jgi:hypothetical protein
MNTPVNSLRNFGYYIRFDANVRRSALNKAATVHGITPVINRLSTIVNLSESGYWNATMKEDLNWLISNKDQASSSSSASASASASVPLQLKLSQYGYSTKKNAAERLFALRSAFIANGYDSVIERMNFVMNNYPKNKNIFQYDLNNFKASCVEPVAETVVEPVTEPVLQIEASTSTYDNKQELLDKINDMRLAIKMMNDTLEYLVQKIGL